MTALRDLSAPARIAGFVAALAVVFAIAFGIGHAVGPWDIPSAPHHQVHEHSDEGPAHDEQHDEHGGE